MQNDGGKGRKKVRDEGKNKTKNNPKQTATTKKKVEKLRVRK